MRILGCSAHVVTEALCKYTHCGENKGQQQELEPTVGTLADTLAVILYSCSHSLVTGIHMAVETNGTPQVRRVQLYS